MALLSNLPLERTAFGVRSLSRKGLLVGFLDFWKVSLYLALAAAFVPCVLFISNSKKAISWKQPQVHRPFALFLGGFFFLVVGLLCVYLAFLAVHSGTVHCALKMCSMIFSLDQPIEYWTSVVAWYGFGVSISGMGVALVRKAFSRPQHAN